MSHDKKDFPRLSSLLQRYGTDIAHALEALNAAAESDVLAGEAEGRRATAQAEYDSLVQDIAAAVIEHEGVVADALADRDRRIAAADQDAREHEAKCQLEAEKLSADVNRLQDDKARLEIEFADAKAKTEAEADELTAKLATLRNEWGTLVARVQSA